MKTYKIITEFRRDFLALDYLHSSMCVSDFKEWVHAWCKNKGFPSQLEYDFFELAYACSAKLFHEQHLYNALKKL